MQREQTLSFVTALPSLAPARNETGPAVITPMPVTAAKPAATHLLEGHRATPLAADGTSLGGGWALQRTATGWQLAGAGAAVLVNGSPGRAEQSLGGGDTHPDR